MREILLTYAKGFSMGAADTVPGVSGATIALIVGIYDRLIRAITELDPRVLSRFAEAVRQDGTAGGIAVFQERDIPFLVTIVLGIASAVVVLSRAMHLAVTQYPVPTYAFFFGLIGASALVLYRQIYLWTKTRLLVVVAGISIAYVVTGITRTAVSHEPYVIFIAGAIAISAMVLPGISGAFFLLILGQYEYLTGTLTRFVDGVLSVPSGGSTAVMIDEGRVVAVFGLGAIVGLLTTAHVVNVALSRYRMATLAFLVSLMVGALRLPYAETATNVGDSAVESLEIAMVAGTVGVLVVFLLDHYTADLEYVD